MKTLCLASFLMLLATGCMHSTIEKKSENASIPIVRGGTWGWDVHRSIHMAGVSGDEKAFMMYCFHDSGECHYLFSYAGRPPCKKGQVTEVMIETDIGKGNVTGEALCAAGSDVVPYRNILYLNNYDEIDHIVKKGNYIRISMPLGDVVLESGKKASISRELKFSLMGSTRAINTMQKSFIEYLR